MAFPPLALDIVFLAVGLTTVYLAAEALVRGAADLARSFGVTPMVIGLTVVAFGTSAPEMVVSGVASARQAGGIALGNVVGSNVANIGLILGVAAVVSPLRFGGEEASREILAVLASAGLMIVMALDGVVSTIEGGVLLVAMAAFLIYSYWQARHGRHALAPVETLDLPPEGRDRMRDGLLVLAGLAGVAVGAWLTVEGAADVARRFGVPEVLIGLTLVALGTSLPELATSAVASYREESDIGVGNVVGSNLFNTLAVLGLAAVIAPVSVDRGTLTVGLPVMVAFSLTLVPFLRPGAVLDRWKGAGLLTGYVALWAYLAWTGAGWAI